MTGETNRKVITSNIVGIDQQALDPGLGCRTESQSVDSVEKLDTSKVGVTREHRALRERPKATPGKDSQSVSIAQNQDTDGRIVDKDLHKTSTRTTRDSRMGEEENRHSTSTKTTQDSQMGKDDNRHTIRR
jgi:hypothetical protein